MASTLHDIAKEVGVSVATVSRVLNGRDNDRISAATHLRVREAATKLGYHPNRFARALVTGRTHFVALWVPYLWYPFAPEVMDSIQRQLDATDYEMIVKGTEGDSARQIEAMSRLTRQVDGIIVVDRPDLLSGLIDRSSRRPAAVSAGTYVRDAVDTVEVDLSRGMAVGVRHLIEQDCSRILYLVPTHAHNDTEARLIAYRRTVEDAGLEPWVVPFGGGSRRTARDAVARMAEWPRRPDAICCHNDAAALGALRALGDLGLRVPDDIALIGCDGVEDTEYTDPRISTVVQPIEEMCRTAWGFLRNRIEDPDIEHQSVTLEAPFVVRASSARAARVGAADRDDEEVTTCVDHV